MSRRQTYLAKPNELNKSWRIVDATGVSLGRLAAEVATVLRLCDAARQPVVTYGGGTSLVDARVLKSRHFTTKLSISDAFHATKRTRSTAD